MRIARKTRKKNRGGRNENKGIEVTTREKDRRGGDVVSGREEEDGEE